MATETLNSDPEDKLPALIAETRSTACLACDNRDKTDGIENRLRQNNICLVGLPQRVEGRDPTDFLENWLLDVISKDAFTLLFAVDYSYLYFFLFCCTIKLVS